MSSSVGADSPADAVLTKLDAAVDALAALDWDALAEDEVLELARRVEIARRRLAPIDHAMIGQLEQRSVAFAHGARTTTTLLSNLLHITRPEAAARVKAAAALGYRRTVTGQRVEPRFPLIAAAQADGVVSDRHTVVIVTTIDRHAVVIVTTIDRLPDPVADEFGAFVERTLVEQARELDPTQLHGHAAALAYALDQDGQLADDAYREKARRLDVHRRPDGSAHLDGDLTAEAAEPLITVLDTLTHPRHAPADNDASAGSDVSTDSGIAVGRDPRTPGQRRHDAFAAALRLVLRAGDLPTVRGVTATVLLTMAADAWITGTGTARTGTGYTIPAAVAERWTRSGTDARFLLALLTKTKAVAAHSGTHRIFSEQQRLALIARDGGCTHPGCDAPPAYTESHHIHEWRDGGRTTVDNGTLVCPFHHRHSLTTGGWRVTMHQGRPHWTAPPHLDPHRTPRRNTRHDTSAPGYAAETLV